MTNTEILQNRINQLKLMETLAEEQATTVRKERESLEKRLEEINNPHLKVLEKLKLFHKNVSLVWKAEDKLRVDFECDGGFGGVTGPEIYRLGYHIESVELVNKYDHSKPIFSVYFTKN